MVQTREDLIYLLTYGAELEHALCCQYLYAALSLKSEPDEGLTWDQLNYVSDWAQKLFMIARMEMEHLSLVCNVLTAIGGAPHMQHVNFPQGPLYFPLGFSLEKFSKHTIKRFVCFERPDDIQPVDAFCCEDDGTGTASLPSETPRIPFQTIGELYQLIRTGLQQIPLSDAELFIGPPRGQVSGYALHVNFPRMWMLGGVWDVTLFPVTDRKSALKAITLILEQGEGTPRHDEFTHYHSFLQILSELEELQHDDPAFQPARNLVSNPALTLHSDAPHARVITNPMARDLLSVFNEAYQTLLLLLIRFYGPSGETQDEYFSLQYVLFPMMTMVVRPLAEPLVRTPAWEVDNGELAGPSFEIDRTIHLLPHKSSAWRVLDERLQALALQCRALCDRPGYPARLAFIAQNLDIMATKFSQIANGQYPADLIPPALTPSGPSR